MPQDQTDLANLLVEALKAAETDGTLRGRPQKYGVESGAIDDFAVNP